MDVLLKNRSPLARQNCHPLVRQQGDWMAAICCAEGDLIALCEGNHHLGMQTGVAPCNPNVQVSSTSPEPALPYPSPALPQQGDLLNAAGAWKRAGLECTTAGGSPHAP